MDGEGGKWYHIQSGSVTGYIKAQYFVTGEEASKIAREVGTTYAKVTNTSTLRLRETPSLEGKTLDLLSADAEYEVIGEEGDFAKISVDNDLVGYVYKDYITTQVDFKQAVSVAEEQQQKAEEEKLKQEANAAIENLEQVKRKRGRVEGSGNHGSGEGNHGSCQRDDQSTGDFLQRNNRGESERKQGS